MPTIEELSTKLAEAEAKIETQMKSLANQPDYSGVHKDSESSWEETDETVNLVIGHEGRGPVAHRNSRRTRVSTKALCKRLGSQHGYKPFNEFKSMGQFLQYGIENRGSQSRIETRVGQHLLAFKAIQGLNTQNGSDGGFMVMPEFANGVLQHMYDNNLWEETDGYSVGPNSNGMTFLASAETSRANGSRAGGMQAYWLGEGATATKSKPTLREINLKLCKAAIVVYFSDEMLKDASAMQQHTEQCAAREFKFLTGDSLFNGTGVGQPLGWNNSPATLSIAKETLQGAATIQTENVEKMYSRFFAPNLQGAKWYHNQDIMTQLDTMILGLGLGAVPVYLPPGGLSAAPYGMLKGRPLQPTEFNSTLGTTGDLGLIDMGQMLTITKGGVEQAVSMHIEFLTDQTAIRLTMRVGGRPWENSPITPYKGTNSQASAIILDTRA